MKKIAACILALILACCCIPTMSKADDGWYENNHAIVFGPKMEDDWKTYAVVDLSMDGVQVLPLVASGLWQIGEVTVTVAGDEVLVEYRMLEGPGTTEVQVDSAYLNFYPQLPTKASTEEPAAFAFGTPLSIARDLGGAFILPMYVELVVDYAAFAEEYRFWPNMSVNRAMAAEMLYNWEHRAD